MTVDISTHLPATPADVIMHLKTPRLFTYVAAPLMKFVPGDNRQLPAKWQEGTYWFSLRLFGFIPLGKQAVVISYPAASNGFMMQDNGYSRLIRKWDHLITVEPAGAGTLYRDTIRVEAGIFTLGVWLFAQLFFRHRQRRWRRLVAAGFNYPPA